MKSGRCLAQPDVVAEGSPTHKQLADLHDTWLDMIKARVRLFCLGGFLLESVRAALQLGM